MLKYRVMFIKRSLYVQINLSRSCPVSYLCGAISAAADTAANRVRVGESTGQFVSANHYDSQPGSRSRKTEPGFAGTSQRPSGKTK